MSKIQLQAAKEFIMNKQYDVARAILQALAEDETAKAWLVTLNKNILPPSMPSSPKNMNIKQLCESINVDESYAELLLRGHLFWDEGGWTSDNPIKLENIEEYLITNLLSGDEEKVKRSCSLIITIHCSSTKMIDALGSIHQSTHWLHPIRVSLENALRELGDRGMIKLYEIWYGMKIEEINFNTIKSGKPGLDTEFRVSNRDGYWFSIKVFLMLKNRYEVVLEWTPKSGIEKKTIH